MDKRRKKQILQYERGNCAGCKYRTVIGNVNGKREYE